ncbi:regulatory protein GemA, partial [Escherichia coli]|nr:regulatory protein GemA [Escherichia coli]
MNRTSLIKLIHVARRELQLDDDTYRAFLMQKTGKISCCELTVTQLEQVLDAMKERGFKKLNKHPRRRFKGHVTPREKVYKVWQQMTEDGFITDGSDVALDRYVQRLTAKRNGGQGVSTLAWCHGDTLLTVLETL